MSTYPIEAHHVKKGGHIMLKGHPCKVVEVKTSKTGKHGHAKCNITGVDVLTARKYNDVAPGHIIFPAFDVQKDELDVMDFDEKEGQLSCLNADGDEKIVPFDDESEVCQKLKKQLDDDKESGAEKYYSCTIVSAPVGDKPESLKIETVISEWKEAKE